MPHSLHTIARCPWSLSNSTWLQLADLARLCRGTLFVADVGRSVVSPVSKASTRTADEVRLPASFRQLHLKSRSMKLQNRIEPTPSDIEIAQAAELHPISAVARDLGLQDAEFDAYGSHKAKVSLAKFCHMPWHAMLQAGHVRRCRYDGRQSSKMEINNHNWLADPHFCGGTPAVAGWRSLRCASLRALTQPGQLP